VPHVGENTSVFTGHLARLQCPIGNGHLGIEWSRDRWPHVTLKGQGRDLDMFGAYCLENGLTDDVTW